MAKRTGSAGATEDLDMGLVAKIARNEAAVLAREVGSDDASGFLTCAVARFHLETYLSDASALEVLAETALREADAIGREALGTAGTSDEYVAGYVLATTAWMCARDDSPSLPATEPRGLIARDFIPRAVLALSLEAVDPARLEGVDPDEPVMSRQSVTPRDIMDRAEAIELPDGRAASEVVSWSDCREIAQRLMDSFGGLELDYADLEEVDWLLADRMTDTLVTGAEPPRINTLPQELEKRFCTAR